MNLTHAKPLFGFSRSNHLEVVVHGFAAFSDSENSISGADGELKLVMRSLLKPWQFLATGLDMPASCWAIAIASHDGDREHIEALAKMTHGQEIAVDNLHCPASYPMLEERAWELRLNQQPEMPVYHPCSGKHLAMAIACKQRGWFEDYTQFDHPIQKRLREIVNAHGLSGGEHLLDSCGLPTLALPLKGIVKMWRRLCEDESEPAVRLKDLWLSHPSLVGGKNRLDSRIIKWGRGQLIAKEGADGLLAVFSVPQNGVPSQGCLIKLTAGYNSRYLGLALWNLLAERQKDLSRPFQELLHQLELARNEWIPNDQVFIANLV